MILILFRRGGKTTSTFIPAMSLPVLSPPIFAMDEARMMLASGGGMRHGGPVRRRRRDGARVRARVRAVKKDDIVLV